MTLLRKALVNDLAHRDYRAGGGSDSVAVFVGRLEIASTGGCHFGLTPADLLRPHSSRSWNPVIASVVFRRGLIEQWGRGTLKIGELAERAGLARPDPSDFWAGPAYGSGPQIPVAAR